VCSSLTPGKSRAAKVNELFVYDNFSRTAVEEVQAGDICAVTGVTDIGVSWCWR
jgi:GTP-binding protein